MSSNILNAARQHLITFLHKVQDGSYTQAEYENFTLMAYQTPELEKIRLEMCSRIALAAKDSETDTPLFDDKNKVFLRDLIDLLEHS